MFCDLVGSTPLSTRFDPEDLREIVGRQLWQNAQVDLVLAESLLVSLQPEPPQPAPNVHCVVPALVLGA